MKQDHEKERKIERKCKRRESEALLSIPPDLTSEILLRLPAKAVLRFRSVSTLWSSISTDPYFTNSFGTRSSIQPSLLVCIKKGENLFVLSFPQHNENPNKSYVCSEPIDSYHMRIPKFRFSNPADSVHGLICFEESGKPIIFNPSTRQLLTLTKPELRWSRDISVFLGYDPIEGKHKVLCMRRDGICEEGRVLTLGSSQESWRAIKTNHKHTPLTSMNGRCINGVLYYMAHPEYLYQQVIMSFDFRSEKFDMMKVPQGNKLINYEGRLACAFDKRTGRTDGSRLWILEDAEKPKWLSKEFPVPSALIYNDDEPTYKPPLELEIKGITHAGEFIYAPPMSHKSFFILFGDPERNTFRKVEFKDIADDEFMMGNGVLEYEIRTFPHHIESLVSL